MKKNQIEHDSKKVILIVVNLGINRLLVEIYF